MDSLIDNINNYIEYLMQPTDFWAYFATVIAPIVSSLAIVIGGAFALYKYLKSKNYDINLKILNEVYVPLYAYLVKQETFRYISLSDSPYEENPILEIRSKKTKHKIDASGISVENITSYVCGCTKDAFIEISEKTNFGLASSELVTLINMYKMLTYVSDGNLITPEKAKASILQHKVELALRKEILTGYKFYREKLKLRKGKSDIFNITEKQIELIPSINKEEIDKMMSMLSDIQQQDNN